MIDFSQISYACRRLSAGGVENADQEGRWMVELLSRKFPGGVSPSSLDSWIDRRISGEPFQYVVGSVEFYDLELQVGPGVLIPRPETEGLVERALELLAGVSAGGRVLDLCTGSGAIPLAIAHARPELHCLGVDLSPEALVWAQKNLALTGITNCEFRLGDLFGGVPAGMRFDLITSNPPYVTPEEYRDLPSVVKDYEPRMALEAADEGLALEKAIIAQAPQWLKRGGALLLEMGETQGAVLADALKEAGLSEVVIRKDLFGRDRNVEGRML